MTEVSISTPSYTFLSNPSLPVELIWNTSSVNWDTHSNSWGGEITYNLNISTINMLELTDYTQAT